MNLKPPGGMPEPRAIFRRYFSLLGHKLDFSATQNRLEAEIDFIPVRTMDEVIKEALVASTKISTSVYEIQHPENPQQAQ